MTQQQTLNPTNDDEYFVCLSTHPGKVRDHNEDNFIVNQTIRQHDPEVNLRGGGAREPLVCAVFDGMGGESNGEAASRLCAAEAAKIIRALKQKTDTLSGAVQNFVTDSNDAVLEMLQNVRAKRGGSTFVMTVLTDGLVYPYSLGDSRLYLYDGETLRQLTEDHTLAMKKYYARMYTLEEAMASSDSHKLTAFLGADDDGGGLAPAAYEPFALNPGEKLLLCSDGLYDMCSHDEILDVLRGESDTLSLDLVDKALENGGKDNITCIVIEKKSSL